MSGENIMHSILTFDECNIAHLNIRPERGKSFITLSEFQYRLENLLRHTSDPCLVESIKSLQTKTKDLSNQEFQQFCKDAAEGKLLNGEEYWVPTI